MKIYKLLTQFTLLRLLTLLTLLPQRTLLKMLKQVWSKMAIMPIYYKALLLCWLLSNRWEWVMMWTDIYQYSSIYIYQSALGWHTQENLIRGSSGNVDYVRSSNIDSSKMLLMQKFLDKKRKFSLPIHLFSKPTVGEVRRCHSY